MVIYIKKGLSILMLLIGVIGILYAGINIHSYINEYKVSEKKYEEIAQMYNDEPDNEQRLLEMNKDYIGWISVEGTEIQYPVVVTDNNEYYLNHNFYNEPDKVGAIFMDYRNSNENLGKNTIIYGHNMKDESMFGSLKKLIHEDISGNPKITFEFKDETYEWEIFTAYETYTEEWMQVKFEDDHEFASYIDTLEYNSDKFPLKENLNSSDKLITLATCTPNDLNERLVVQGKLIKDE